MILVTILAALVTATAFVVGYWLGERTRATSATRPKTRRGHRCWPPHGTFEMSDGSWALSGLGAGIGERWCCLDCGAEWVARAPFGHMRSWTRRDRLPRDWQPAWDNQTAWDES